MPAIVLNDSSGKERKRRVTSYRKYLGFMKKMTLLFMEPANLMRTVFSPTINLARIRMTTNSFTCHPCGKCAAFAHPARVIIF